MKNFIQLLISIFNGVKPLLKVFNVKEVMGEFKEAGNGLFSKGKQDPVSILVYVFVLIGLIASLVIAWYEPNLGHLLFDSVKDIDNQLILPGDSI